MRQTRFAFLRLLAILLAVLLMVGCSPKTEAPIPSAPETTTAPTTPTEPTEPPKLTEHGKLRDYLTSNGAVTVKDAAYTFTMKTEKENILLVYENNSTKVTVTLSDGAATCPVEISFAIYSATAQVDVATYTNTEHTLSNFQCNTPDIAVALGQLATTAVWTCFTQAAKAMAPSGVTLVSLGFVKYFG